MRASTGADGEIAAGYLIGRQDASVAGLNTTLTSLAYSETFDHLFSQVTQEDLGGGNSATGLDTLRSAAQFSYDAGLQSFRYQDSSRGITGQAITIDGGASVA